MLGINIKRLVHFKTKMAWKFAKYLYKCQAFIFWRVSCIFHVKKRNLLWLKFLWPVGLFFPNGMTIWAIIITRMYSPLRRLTFSSCQGLRPRLFLPFCKDQVICIYLSWCKQQTLLIALGKKYNFFIDSSSWTRRPVGLPASPLGLLQGVQTEHWLKHALWLHHSPRWAPVHRVCILQSLNYSETCPMCCSVIWATWAFPIGIWESIDLDKWLFTTEHQKSQK